MSDLFDIKTLQGLDLSKLRSTSICVLGGTGFIGTWLISTLNQLDRDFGLKIEIAVYTRDIRKASVKYPRELYNRVSLKEFDFLTGACNLGFFDYIINGATPTTSKAGINTEDLYFHPTMNAVRSIIATAQSKQNYPKVLNLSSGAVYGSQPLDLLRRPEGLAVDPRGSDYYQRAKYQSEYELSTPEALGVLAPISPRLFAFYGPGLPINQHFAIGNFIRDGLEGRPIRILGNPNTRRSYMYPTDLVAWLLKSMVNPKVGHFNIGSEDSISMAELASLVSEMTSRKGIEFSNPEIPPNNYVPSTKLFRTEYDVEELVPLSEGLLSWKSWLTRN